MGAGVGEGKTHKGAACGVVPGGSHCAHETGEKNQTVGTGGICWALLHPID